MKAGVGEMEAELLLELVGAPQIVVVAEGDPGGGGVKDAGVAGGGDAGVGLAEEADGGAEGLEVCGDWGGRAVVDENDFGWGEGLGEDGCDGLAEEVGAVVGGDDDADDGRGHGCSGGRVTRGGVGEKECCVIFVGCWCRFGKRRTRRAQ